MRTELYVLSAEALGLEGAVELDAELLVLVRLAYDAADRAESRRAFVGGTALAEGVEDREHLPVRTDEMGAGGRRAAVVLQRTERLLDVEPLDGQKRLHVLAVLREHHILHEAFVEVRPRRKFDVGAERTQPIALREPGRRQARGHCARSGSVARDDHSIAQRVGEEAYPRRAPEIDEAAEAAGQPQPGDPVHFDSGRGDECGDAGGYRCLGELGGADVGLRKIDAGRPIT